jgi:hypothetical protein
VRLYEYSRGISKPSQIWCLHDVKLRNGTFSFTSRRLREGLPKYIRSPAPVYALIVRLCSKQGAENQTTLRALAPDEARRIAYGRRLDR